MKYTIISIDSMAAAVIIIPILVVTVIALSSYLGLQIIFTKFVI